MTDRRREILVADDEETIVTLLEDALTREGHHVTTAMDGAAALKKMEKTRFDLVLLDIMMPERSGEDVLAEMENHEWGDVPVVVLTGMHPSDATIQFVLDSPKVVQYVRKPIMIEELLAAVRDALRKRPS